MSIDVFHCTCNSRDDPALVLALRTLLSAGMHAALAPWDLVTCVAPGSLGYLCVIGVSALAGRVLNIY